MTISFSKDIKPIFNQFKGQMMWRLDLTDYETVKANALTIWGRVSGANGFMPPPPFAPLSDTQIQQFKEWMDGGCPP